MKKNKSILESVKKQKLTFVAYNLIAYLIIFIALGIFAVVSIDNIFYKSATDTVMDYAQMFNQPLSFPQAVARPRDPRMQISFYDGGGDWVINAVGTQLIQDEIDVFVLDRLQQETLSITLIVQDETITNEVNYLTILKRVDIERDDIQYAKIYMNVDGEVTVRNEIIKVYVICVAVMFVFSAFASYLLSNNTMKPIVNSLEKQMTFVGDASHELRTPLAIVQSKLENIMTDSDKTVYEVADDLAVSLKELSRLTKLTSDLLMLARSDNENINLDMETVRLDALIKETIEPFVELANLQNKKFVYQVDPITTKIDKNKMNQVLIILLDNALAYTNEEDCINISLHLDNNDIQIVVEDTGIGISDENHNRIFERFFREDRARSRITGGNGLGLSIAKTLIQLHHGKILVEKNNPKGSRFIINLPKIK